MCGLLGQIITLGWFFSPLKQVSCCAFSLLLELFQLCRLFRPGSSPLLVTQGKGTTLKRSWCLQEAHTFLLLVPQHLDPLAEELCPLGAHPAKLWSPPQQRICPVPARAAWSGSGLGLLSGVMGIALGQLWRFSCLLTASPSQARWVLACPDDGTASSLLLVLACS